MADKRISQLVERTDIANNDVLPIVASGATTTNKVTVSTLQDWMQENLDVGVTSVGLSMPSAFTVSNSPVTTSGNISVTGAGTVSQYIRGDGTLADFPSSTGGGSSVSYYLNGSVSQGTIGGVAYLEMNKTPVLGSGTDFTINANGYIASFITDAGDPALLEIPGGNWNFETYFSASSGGGTPSFYVELYKVNSGGTATLIASNSTNPELIAFGTTTTSYFSSLAVPTTTLALTDRLALRYYVNHSGRTITLHTEDNNLCQVITTFTTGLTALNGLTAQVQNLATGTSGSDFNISSASTTHTFNLPDASTSARGVVTTGAQNFAGNKSFQNTIFVNAGLRLDQNGTALPTFVQNISGTGLISSGSNGLGFNNSNNLYFSGSDKGGAVFAVNNTAVRTYTLQDANGTLAFTSDISSAVAGYLPLTGGTLTGPLYGQSASFSSAGSSFISIVKTGGVSLNLNAVGTAASIATSTNHDLEFYRNNILVAKFTTGSVTTLYGALNGTSGNFSGDLQSSTRLIAAASSQSIILTPNSGGTTNRVESVGTLPLALVSAAAITMAAGGTTPQITLATTGAVTLTGALNGTSASFGGTGTGNNVISISNNDQSNARLRITNTGSGGRIYSIVGGLNGANNSSFSIYDETAGSTRFEINSTGSATFSSTVRVGGASGGDSLVTTANAGTNPASFSFVNTGGTSFIGAESSTGGSLVTGSTGYDLIVRGPSGISFSANNGASPNLRIASTGAATFSSSVTAGGEYYLSVNNSYLRGRNSANTAYIAAIGINGSNKVAIDPDNNGSVFGGAATFSSSVTAVGATFSGTTALASTGGTSQMRIDRSGSVARIQNYDAGSAANISLAWDGGNVGIGTASPDWLFRVEKNTNAAAYGTYPAIVVANSDNAGYSAHYLFKGTTNKGGIEYSNSEEFLRVQSAGSLLFNTAGTTERMRITSGGNVLINRQTSSGGSLRVLDFLGNSYSGGSGSGYFWEDRSNSANYYGWYSTSNTIFLFNGSANAASINPATGVYTPLSDVNKKKDFENSTIGLNEILNLKPTLYRMESDESEGEKELGFIAQEVKEFIPQAYVESGEEDTKFIGLNYNAIVAALVKSVQELKAEIDSLKNQIK